MQNTIVVHTFIGELTILSTIPEFCFNFNLFINFLQLLTKIILVLVIKTLVVTQNKPFCYENLPYLVLYIRLIMLLIP